MSDTERRVLVVLRRHGSREDRILRGLFAAADARGWTLLHADATPAGAHVVRTWQPDAIVLGQWWPTIRRLTARRPVSLVGVGVDLTDRGIPSVVQDDLTVGREAADYLLESGVRHFAYFGDPSEPWSVLRARGYEQRLAGRGLTCARWWDDPAFGAAEPWSGPVLARWLRPLPKPVAILCGCDGWAQPLLGGCAAAKLRVPEDVLVLGVDDDDLLCRISRPPLSSIAVPWDRMGEQVAELLHRARIDGAGDSTRRVLITPIGVVPRRSTDALAVPDPDVAAALTLIRAHAGRPLRVTTILRHVPAYQHKLERGFRKYVGRTMLQEIRRVHVERAKHLLATTVLPLTEVAHRSGFPNATKLGVAFRHATGTTPGEYRAQRRSPR